MSISQKAQLREEDETIVQASTIETTGGSIRINIPAWAVTELENEGFIETGLFYLKAKWTSKVACPHGHNRPYVLKRNEKHPPGCADCVLEGRLTLIKCNNPRCVYCGVKRAK